MVWNFAGGKKERQAFRYIGHSAAVTSVAFDATHGLIASSSKDKSVRLWKPSAEGRSTVLKAHTATVRACNFSANGCMLATCSDDKTVKVGRNASHCQVVFVNVADARQAPSFLKAFRCFYCKPDMYDARRFTVFATALFLATFRCGRCRSRPSSAASMATRTGCAAASCRQMPAWQSQAAMTTLCGFGMWRRGQL